MAALHFVDVILETEHDPRHEGKQLLEALSFCEIDIGNITFGEPEERVGPFPSVVPDWQEASRKLWIIRRF